MEVLFIIALIAWVFISAGARKKQQEARAAAARERARQRELERLESEQASHEGPMPQRAPIAPSVKPTVITTVDDAPSQPIHTPPTGRMSAPLPVSTQRKAAAGTMVQEAPASRLTQAKGSRLTAAKGTSLHVVEASSISGHAHEESSLSGIKDACEPDGNRGNAPATSPSKAARPGFQWSRSALINGVVMAEILGPCAAMRE